MLEKSAKSKQKVAYSVKEVAQETSLSVPHLRNEIRGGKLKACRIGRRVIILHEALEEYLKRGYDNQ